MCVVVLVLCSCDACAVFVVCALCLCCVYVDFFCLASARYSCWVCCGCVVIVSCLQRCCVCVCLFVSLCVVFGL